MATQRRSKLSATRQTSFLGPVDAAILAQEWSSRIIEVDEVKKENNCSRDVARAAERAIPLLEDSTSVPFVCRYRPDIIYPLSNKQIHVLCDLVVKHKGLESFRRRVLEAIPTDSKTTTNSDATSCQAKPHKQYYEELVRRIQTATSKTELEDLYAPFKPPSKGSPLERIQKEHPWLVQQVDRIWNGKEEYLPSPQRLEPRDALITSLSTKIASEPVVFDSLLQVFRRRCRITTTEKKADAKSKDKTAKQHSGGSDSGKYHNYHNLSSYLSDLRDHQVLAIRRGIDQKALTLGYSIDADKAEGCIRYHLMNERLGQDLQKTYAWREVMSEAIHDAWTRLLRRRLTTRLWTEKCKAAEARAIHIFEDNLLHGLLAPPLSRSTHVLALDPGYQAGIKCAIIDPAGTVLKDSLQTVKFLDRKQRHGALEQLGHMLAVVQGHLLSENDKKKEGTLVVTVALGNGHGSHECRRLIDEASKAQSIPISIHLVNEAGASVWSVTEAAKEEFPNESAASIAAISIGRRLQNPLHELVKVPPRSLGLGMYQHDLSEHDLDERLHLASVDAVATVGVDLNTCSLEILQKVPGLKRLAAKVIKARPFRKRDDLLKVTGLGNKTFENCAAFCRVQDGLEELDATCVHPESYALAKWLLKEFDWELGGQRTHVAIPQKKEEWIAASKDSLMTGAAKFDTSRERILAVVENLWDSMSRVDPRRRGSCNKTTSTVGSILDCSMLPSKLHSADALRDACPVRNVFGTVRNIADFGAFVDFGGHNDGLLHPSRMGPVLLRSLLIGQEVGVDIIKVDPRGKVGLALAGLGLDATEDRAMTKRSVPNNNGSKANGRGRPMSTLAKSSKRKHESKPRHSVAHASTVPSKRRRIAK